MSCVLFLDIRLRSFLYSFHPKAASYLSAVAAPQYSLADLAKMDGRVEAHLDRLRIAGEEGWKFCEEQLAANEEGEVFTAGGMAFESGKPELVAKVLSAVEEEPKTVDGLVSALRWLSVEQALPHIQSFLGSDKPVHQRVGIAAAAIHLRHPGEALARLVWLAANEERGCVSSVFDRIQKSSGWKASKQCEWRILTAKTYS